MVTVACEHSPIFLAHVDSESLLTLDYTVMLSVIEWHNSLTKPDLNQAYFQQDALVFCFPEENGEWLELAIEPDGTYQCPDWLEVVGACPKCLCYVPCDCDFRLVDEPTLQTMEFAILTQYGLGVHPLTNQDMRDLIYTIRELEAQLKVEQEVHK